MSWEVITPDLKKDELGNELQSTGAVKPVACQQCKKKFESRLEEKKITQTVPITKCNNCSFESGSRDQIEIHVTANPTHTTRKSTKERIVSVDKIAVGIIPYVIKDGDNVKVICGGCRG